MGRFEGRVVLITGGSSGIGLATARAFLSEGAKVAITGRSLERLKKAERELRRLGEVLALPGDVARAADVKRFVAKTKQAFGPIDVLVNNAGIFISRTLEATTEREYDQMVDINLKGVYLCAKAVLPSMRRRKRGAIVNVASDAGLVGNRSSAVYCASKGGLVLLTKAMALDHAKEGIRINVVCPGEVDTPMLWREAELSGHPAKYYRELVDPIPLGRAAKPGEIARAILFLAGDESSFITGTAISVDGGSTAV